MGTSGKGTSRRTHVLRQALQEYASPPGPGECICKAHGSRGSNHIDVELPNGERTLMLLPARFHRKIWIRKGSYVIVEMLADHEHVDESVRGQIARVLMQDDVKHLKSMEGVWPERFAESPGREDVVKDMESLCLGQQGDKALVSLTTEDGLGTGDVGGDDGDSSDEDGLPPLDQIQNRRNKNIHYAVSDSDSE